MAHNLLFVDHAEGLGGAERSLLLLLRHLDRAQWCPHLACSGGPLAAEAEALGVPVFVIPLPRLRRSVRFLSDWWKGAQALAHIARKIRSRLVIANTVRAAFYAALAACLAGIPFVWYMRDFWLSEERPRHLWGDRLGKRFLCAAAVRVIANSHATASHLPCRNVTVILNGIEVEQYDPALDGRPFREHFGIPADVPLVGMVGRLRPWKGQDHFLRMLAQVREARPDVWGVVVGGTPLGEDAGYPALLHRMAHELGLAERVVFTGHLEDVRPALAAMDVFVHPGDPEPFGLVNIEAMAMGKPVVAFAHGALPEILIHEETGLLVPPGDEKALGEAVLALLDHPEWRRTMGQKGRARVETGFTVQQMVGAIQSLCRTLLSERCGGISAGWS